jgi:hypothetical protein
MSLEELLWAFLKYGDWRNGVHLTVKEKIAALRLLKRVPQY